jgi:phosphopantothenoylcysteine decarboxylase/phosphopantothenate--cysteine ligase
MIRNKRILLGICGSIAAYKTPHLVRLLKKHGAEVQTILTPDAQLFVTPTTLATVSQNPCYSAFTNADDGTWNNHVALAEWADLLIIAPASANTLAKMATGRCDNLLMATYLSAKCPVMIAPAMDLDMFQHPTTSDNIQQIQSFGHQILDPGTGFLASGLEGKGRMMEPEEIVEHINQFFHFRNLLIHQHWLVTAGPTYENIDPVRFIGNYSSGKMGYEIAEALAAAGADVTLVSGPSSCQIHSPKIKKISVQSAQNMLDACLEVFPHVHGVVKAAAVADYRPAVMSSEKIKKNDETFAITLVKNPDILSALGQLKTHQKLIGFALETENELINAQSKLKKKNLDAIVLNTLKNQGAGFQTDTNVVTWISEKEEEPWPLLKKSEVAFKIVEKIVSM